MGHLKFSLFKKFCVLTAASFLLMGNEGCEQAQNKSDRQLKRRAELSRLEARKVQLPQGGTFDFQYVMNAQIVDVMRESDFTFPYPDGSVGISSVQVAGTDLQIMVSEDDANMIADVTSLMDVSSFASQMAKVPECVLDVPQAVIGGDVLSFEVSGGGGIQIGYNSGGSFNPGPGVGLSIFVEKAKLDLIMRASHALSGMPLSSTEITSDQTKLDLGLNINFGLFSISPSYFFQTRLAEVSRNGLTKGLASLAKAMDEDAATRDWESQVISDLDSHILFHGGSQNRIQVGDKFQIYNLEYFWKGSPCSGQFQGAFNTTREPAAIVEVEQVQAYTSYARVVQRGNMNVLPGARVMVMELKPDPAQAKAP